MVDKVDKKRGKFRGPNPYKDLREFKSKEIKKSLVHKARLRKNYYKLLEKEGQAVPEKRGSTGDNNDNEDVNKQRKPMNYAERAKKTKELKEQRRKDKLEAIREKKQIMEAKAKERERRLERVSQKTTRGQPLMGPRINNLLDKIKKDME